MKVLFAVNNENISESIIKLYQKEYREIISGKNVYYFNAIIKELQRDQSYDRVVISEDLEPYTNSNIDFIDKFLFEQLDKISDEATTDTGADIPIIFIATDRRSKSDNLLSKLFSIGVYDALLGSDRSIPEVCKLLNKPRTKKEAKVYYKIETEEVEYKAESEDSVSETEIQNILTYYKRLGRNTDRYVESFDNIAAQYNDAQLRIISTFLPINVRAVLEAESPKYQSIMTFGEGTYKGGVQKEEPKDDLKIGFIETQSNKGRPTKPVVIPSAVNKNAVSKLTRKIENPEDTEEQDSSIDANAFSDIMEEVNEPVVKRGRGRPKKQIDPAEALENETKVKRGRGRPKKQVEEPAENDNILPGFDEIEENTLPGFENLNETSYSANDFEEPEDKYIEDTSEPQENDLTRLLSRDKKVVAFVGTTKCGTSFLVNNIADVLANENINTAILDVTSNKNSYYIYTKNEEQLRKKASGCMEALEQGVVNGINVSRNLTVFTSVPGKKIEADDVQAIVGALLKKYSLVILDCDFKTAYEYFNIAQEIYLVQSMDILTIQPLTAFLRDLETINMNIQSKFKIVLNKAMRVRGLSEKAIVGGMSCYNDPEMSYMRDLFNRDKIQVITIPFDEDALSKYLSGIVDCIVTTNGYSKQFMSELKTLADDVYPLVTNKYRQDYSKNNKFANENQENNFSNSMNSTLAKMKGNMK